MSTLQHYSNHLAPVYPWMVGDFGQKQKEQEKILGDSGIRAFGNRVAIDLGAGHGLQSISLANLGFKVYAVDFSPQLLEALDQAKGNRNIETVQHDILQYIKSFPEQAAAITCMGDTLTHLSSYDEVSDLIEQISIKLESKGKVVLSFRDLTKALCGIDRFIPVKSDDRRILSCFLEYHQDKVIVHDVLYEHNGDQWVQRVSAYTKLRLSAVHVTQLLNINRIEIVNSSTVNGMLYLVGQKIS